MYSNALVFLFLTEKFVGYLHIVGLDVLRRIISEGLRLERNVQVTKSAVPRSIHCRASPNSL